MSNQRPSDLARVAKVSYCKWQLAAELHKAIIRTFEKRKVCLSFKDNIWGAELTNMQSISKLSKRFQFLLTCY